MQLYLGVLIFSFLVVAVTIVPFINFLYRRKMIQTDERRELTARDTKEFVALRTKQSAKAGTPTGLGVLLIAAIALLFGILFPVLLLPKSTSILLSGFPTGKELAVIYVTFLGFGLIGLYDDVMKIYGFSRTGFFGLRVSHKFGLQWLVALASAAMLYWGLGINIIHVPVLGVLHISFFYLPLAAFLIVTFANAFDITSGLDALGEGLLMLCLMAFWVIALAQLDQVLQLFIAIWLGALIAGVYFTVHPARAFLGNASGMAFGATLALVGLLSGKFVPLLVVGGLFLVDGGSSLLQILSVQLFKKRIFPIAPVHHWLELRGWEEPKIVARAWLTGLILAIFGVWLAFL